MNQTGNKQQDGRFKLKNINYHITYKSVNTILKGEIGNLDYKKQDPLTGCLL